LAFVPAIRKLLGVSLGLASLFALWAPASSPAAVPGPHVFRRPAARPTDHPDPNRHSYSVPEAPASPSCTRHFCVHWVAEGVDAPNLKDSNGYRDGDGVPDFVEEVQKVAEHVYSVENGKLGWRKPKSDGRRGGGDGKTDVYLAEVGGSLFGYAAPDKGQTTKGHPLPRRLHGYLVLDNDYDPFEFPGTTPLHDLEVTFAHEYNHILQFGYDAYEDSWFAESTATWMEDQVYGNVNDYLRYVHRWVDLYDVPMTAATIKEYGTAVWNHWLARRYGRKIIREAWAGAIHVKPAGFSVGAYDRAIRRAGNSDFDHDFARFSRDVAEWRTDTAFPEGNLYEDVPREGALPLNGDTVGRALNHTTFQMLRVHPGRGREVVVSLTTPLGDSSGIALVGRLGSELGGQVISRLTYRASGGPMTVRLPDPGRFSRVTAVLINADTSAIGFSARQFDWNYLTDMAPFRARARLVR
jgi:Family of unknown function (DUF6055)